MKLTKKVLHRVAKPVEFKWPYQNQLLMDDLYAFMRQQGAIGLAAPQIGQSKRVFVMLVHGRERACFNPEVLGQSHTLADFDEGCLSFPGDQCTIKRPDWIEVRYQDHQGKWINDNLVGLEARCFQHELDHLDGITMWDRHKEQNAKQS